MCSLKRPKRRWWGWLFAVAYLVGSISPSLAMPFAVGQRDGVAHHTEQSNARRGCHEHHRAGVAPAHLRDVAAGVDKSSVGRAHSSCCSSLCFSAVSPQPASIHQLATPRFRCDSEPDLKIDEGTLARRYRPPIV